MNSIPIKCHPYVSENMKIQKFNTPYNYVIIDNFLTDEVYNKLCNKFPRLISKVEKPVGKILDNFYNAYIYSLTESDLTDGYDFFTEEIYKDFIANIFNLELNQHTAYSIHFHQGSPEHPSKSGWSHADLSLCSVINDKNKKIKLAGFDCLYQDDTNLQPKTSKVARQVAMIYYLNNKTPLDENDGGGTGVYENYELSSLVKEVKPINNRLFAFEICPHSYHGFIGAKFDRSAIVQWFHSDPNYFLKRNLNDFKKRKQKTGMFFERWSKEELYNLEQSPSYFNYFSESINDLLK